MAPVMEGETPESSKMAKMSALVIFDFFLSSQLRLQKVVGCVYRKRLWSFIVSRADWGKLGRALSNGVTLLSVKSSKSFV